MDIQHSKTSFRNLHTYRNVDKNLIRGGAPSVKNLIHLKQEGVNQVYDFRHHGIRGFKFVEVIACKMLGIKYNRKKISFLYDQMPNLADFEDVSRSIKANGENGGKTLLHCNSGRHRTAQMVAFYELTKGETLEKTKELYPKSYPLRAKIVFDRLANSKDYFNRKYDEVLSKNPIKRVFQKWNNNVIKALNKSLDAFSDILFE